PLLPIRTVARGQRDVGARVVVRVRIEAQGVPVARQADGQIGVVRPALLGVIGVTRGHQNFLASGDGVRRADAVVGLEERNGAAGNVRIRQAEAIYGLERPLSRRLRVS